MYDTSSQICFQVMKLDVGIRSIHWVHINLFEHFSKFAGFHAPSEPQNNMENEGDKGVKVKYEFLKTSDPNLTKNIPEDYFILGILQNNQIMLLKVSQKVEFYASQFLLNQDSFNYVSLLADKSNQSIIFATGSKNGEVFFHQGTQNDVSSLRSFKFNNYHISSIKFNKKTDQNIFCATSSHDRKIVIYDINTVLSNEGLHEIKIIPRMLFK